MTPNRHIKPTDRRLGNHFHHEAAKAKRPSVKRCIVDGERCVLVPLTRGKWTIVSARSFGKVKDEVWCYSNKYAIRNGKAGEAGTIWMHRVLADIPEGFDTDHVNGDRLDNRDSNIRQATRTQNCINRPLQKNNKSGVAGVSQYNRGPRWTVRININKKARFLGLFVSLEEAVAVRKRAELEHYGEFKPRVPLSIVKKSSSKT